MAELEHGEDGLARPSWAMASPLLRHYYDTEWGVPVTDERGVFERISLEVFQSGLSWATILAKREAFRERFEGFNPDAVAAWGDAEVERALADAGIVRNLRKVRATVQNARATLALRERGGIGPWVWSHLPKRTPTPASAAEVPTTSPESSALASSLKQVGFGHVGPTTMHALMEAIGMVDTHLLGSHRRGVSQLWNADGSARTDSPARLALPGQPPHYTRS